MRINLAVKVIKVLVIAMTTFIVAGLGLVSYGLFTLMSGCTSG